MSASIALDSCGHHFPFLWFAAVDLSILGLSLIDLGTGAPSRKSCSDISLFSTTSSEYFLESREMILQTEYACLADVPAGPRSFDLDIFAILRTKDLICVYLTIDKQGAALTTNVTMHMWTFSCLRVEGGEDIAALMSPIVG
ncbi:hypothetical protein R3P38DRAFT_3418698 [Favolaschia claudopus]|uniref:Uncharacterized protein n=1 Tax=Favolaschia claudopus TaxID=2862362 RepID=A0AAW0EHQ2_9AGAR